jgi:hypothetical protein
MMIDRNHWLLVRECLPGAGSSVSGSGYTGDHDDGRDRVLDRLYIRSLFETAPDDALACAMSVIRQIHDERLGLKLRP